MISVLAVFWYRDKHFYGEESIIGSKQVIAYGDYMQVDVDHYQIWDKYAKQMGLCSRIPYDKIPRGRVLFHIPTHSYVVVGSKAIVNNNEVKRELLEYYGLPLNTEFRWDEHYR